MSEVETSKEELPLQSHSVEYVYEAIKRTLNLHPDDYRSARAAMRFILNKHEKAMLDISCPLYKKEKYDE